MQAKLPEPELLKEPDGLKALALAPVAGAERETDLAAQMLPRRQPRRPDQLSSPSLPAIASAYSVLGCAVADFIAAAMMPSTCSVVLGSKLRWRVASSLP